MMRRYHEPLSAPWPRARHGDKRHHHDEAGNHSGRVVNRAVPVRKGEDNETNLTDQVQRVSRAINTCCDYLLTLIRAAASIRFVFMLVQKFYILYANCLQSDVKQG